MKRTLSFLLVLGMLLSMIPAVWAEETPQSVDRCCHTLRPGARTNLSRPQFTGKLYELSRQRVDDTFRYLDEMYVQQYPEAALTVNDMDEEDRQVLRTLAGIITEDCETDREKADAISSWVARNILYDVNSSAYPNDTFYNRIGNCMSYAMLMQTLLRFSGIPAAWGDGWRGDMKENTVELFDYEGHAWCFAYVDEQWLLYDPLWLSEPTTDREYMAEWIWMDTVECVTPAYDPENLPPEAWDKPKTYYTDGVFCVFDESHPEGYGNFTNFVNNRAFNFTPRQDEPDGSGFDGWYYVDSTKDETGIRKGEVYRDGWLSYGEYGLQSQLCLTYAHFNGMQIDGSVMEFDGVDRMIQANQSFEILADPEDYSICYGAFAMMKGYTGPFLAEPWGDLYRSDEYVTTWESDTPEVAVVDNQGNITCLDEGFAQIKLTLTDHEMDSGYYSITYLNIYVADEERVPDYTDHPPVSEEPPVPDGTIPPESEEPIPSEPQEQPTEPQQPELSDFTDVVPGAFYVEPVAWAVQTGVTNGTSPTTFSPSDPCKRSQVVTFLWRAEGEPEFTSEEIAFTDVLPGKFYTDSVAWAVENGITNGMGDGTFGVNQVCNRAQVVTFLWRTAGKPEPKSDQCPFTDVQPGSYYYDAVLWAVEEGITNGMGDGIFGVSGDCTRGQIVTFLWRYVHN